MKAVVKVQLPISPPGPTGIDVLVYDKKRIHEAVQNLNKTEVAMVGKLYKSFFHAEWKYNRWNLLRLAPWQQW
jgi:hypothetical protein